MTQPDPDTATKPRPKVQHIVMMRFSYPAVGGFKLSQAAPDDIRATLYDPERLERRFALFETLTLPTLLQQKPHSATIALITGEDLPQPFRARLDSLLAPLAHARVFALPSIPQEVAHVLNLLKDPQADFIATTRLDDDDAIACDLLARIERLCAQVLETGIVSPPVALAFNNGLFLEKGADGVRIYGVSQKTPLGIGLTLLGPKNMRQTVFTRDHRAAGAFWNCITDGVTPSFIRSVHRDNDSGAWSDGPKIDYSDAQLRALLRTRFGLDLDCLR
jgi:hypothetical protein